MNSRLICFLSLAALALVGCASTPAPSDGPDAVPVDNGVQSQSQPLAAPNNDVYRLGQGDTIAIQVFDEPDLTLDTAVGASGSINYSYLGDVRVAGKTTVELEQHIATLLQDGYLVNPSVNVSVLTYRPFYINGEVKTPGSYPYEPGLTIDRAIALSGGLTDRASTRKIFVNKEGAASSEELRVPLSFRVQPGDTITIREGFF